MKRNNATWFFVENWQAEGTLIDLFSRTESDALVDSKSGGHLDTILSILSDSESSATVRRCPTKSTECLNVVWIARSPWWDSSKQTAT